MSKNPEPQEVKRLRVRYGFTQTEAAEAVHVTIRAWQWWESGKRRIPMGLWELFVIKTGFHPQFQDVKLLSSKATTRDAATSY